MVVVAQPQFCQNRFTLVFICLLAHLCLFREILADGNTFHDLLQNGCILAEHRILRQISHTNTAGTGDGSAVGKVQSGNNFKQGGFSGSVNTNQTDFISLVDCKGTSIQKLAVAVTFGKVFCVE